MTDSFRLKKRGPYIPAFIATVLIVLLFDFLGFFEGVNRHAYDLFFRIRGSRAPSHSIVIAAIDEKTLEALGRWPIARAYYADLLDKLEPADAVAFDIIFAEPSDHDRELAMSIQANEKVVLAAHLGSDGKIVYPHRSLGAQRFGHVHIELDTDGIAREIYNTVTHNGVALRSFASEVYESAHCSPFPPAGRDKELCTAAIVQSDPMMINFYGPAGTFQRISFLDVLQGRYPPDFFEGRTVLVGITAHGVENGILIPFTTDRNGMPGVEVNASALNNMLDGSFIRPLQTWLVWSLAVLCITASFLVFASSQATSSFFFWAGGLLALTTGIFALFTIRFVWAPPGVLWTSITLPFLVYCVLELKQMYRSLVQAKKEWEESFNTIDDAIVIQDKKGGVVRMNHAGREMVGDFLLQTLQRRGCAPWFAAGVDDFPLTPLDEEVKELIRTEEVFHNDTGKYYEIKSLPRRDAGGSFLGSVQVVRDISLRKRAEEEKQKLQMLLIQVQKMEAIGTLAGGIAHDFNNILAPIIGYCELALMEIPADTRLYRNIEQVFRSGCRAKDLVKQILTFSRKTEQEPRPVQVSLLVKETLQMLRSTLPSTIEIRRNIDRDATNSTVLADPTQIHQVLMNLCTNAAHAMREKAGVLSITLKNVDIDSAAISEVPDLAPGSYLKLSVSDTGHGMDEAVRRRIFDPYFTTKGPSEGTGLGLSLVYGIITSLSGGIAVFSEPGRGTTFNVYFPRTETLQAPMVEASEPLPIGKGLVLVVDDEQPIVDMLKQMLGSLGYDVAERYSSYDALQAFRARPDSFDLVISDLTMPHMTGVDLAREILKIRPDTPIILCTGFSAVIDVAIARKIGVKAFLMKPVTLQRLAEEIHKLLNQE